MFKKYLSLLIIIFIAALTRFWALGSFPSGLNADEAALGYNAYSLYLTGKDEHGHLMPVNLESFGDYKPALYSYLLVPLMPFAPTSELAVRFPSALAGVASVFFLYILIRLLSPDRKLALVSALLLAISPWHLHFSRGAWEVNLATFFLILGSVLFLYWTKKRYLSALYAGLFFFTASMYTYQSARLIAPLLGLGLVWIFRRSIKANLTAVTKGALFLAFILSPLVLSLLFSDAASRVGGVGLMADEGPLNFVKELRGHHSATDAIIGRLLHNRPVIYSLQFIKNYLSHFDGDFLFVSGDVIERNLIPETGLLYLSDFFLILLGLLVLIRQPSPLSRVIFIWLAVAPVASALTFQVPHALRAQNLVIPLTVLSASGLVLVQVKLKSLNRKYLRLFCSLLIISVYLFQFSRYLHQYYVHYPRAYPSAWEYGFRELVSYVSQNGSRYQQVLITDKYDQPYILFLYYLQYPPSQFQGQHQLTVRDKYNFSTVTEFSNFKFTSTAWDQVRDRHDSLIIAAPEDIPPVGVNIVKTINFPNGQPAFKIISN